ncbi:MAG: T9SS type A sorting domain-containing protein, partial [Candidatus Zixiibacteriota bacterium]
EIYNLLGQRIAVLADGEFTSGWHSFTWDARSAASGIYLYRLTADDFIQSRKMVLMK